MLEKTVSPNDDNSSLSLDFSGFDPEGNFFYFENEFSKVFIMPNPNRLNDSKIYIADYEHLKIKDKKNSEDNINNNEQIGNKILSDIKPENIASSNVKKNSNIIMSKNDGFQDICEVDSTNLTPKKCHIKRSKKKEGKKLNKKKLKKKSKRLLINAMISYVNDIIKKVYGGKIGKGIINQKIIKKIEPSESQNISIAHNKKLLKKTLKEILSAHISKRFTSVIIPDINKIIINKLLNEEDEDKRQIFNDLFNKTFKDWILILSDPKGELK